MQVGILQLGSLRLPQHHADAGDQIHLVLTGGSHKVKAIPGNNDIMTPLVDRLPNLLYVCTEREVRAFRRACFLTIIIRYLERASEMTEMLHLFPLEESINLAILKVRKLFSQRALEAVAIVDPGHTCTVCTEQNEIMLFGFRFNSTAERGKTDRNTLLT
jgi:hypothetical protein